MWQTPVAMAFGLGLRQLKSKSLGDMNEAEALDEYEQFDFGDINLRQAALKDIQELKTKLRGAIKRQHTARNVTLRDKISFVIGTTLAILSAYWLGYSPATFNRAIYTWGVLVLFTLRYVMYRIKKWHYYVYDFCYLANILLLVHIWFFPHSAFLHKVTFAYGMGPLAWSIIAFRNSLVFHSLDKNTSLFLHWFPAVVAWTQRWHSDVHVKEYIEASPEAKQDWDTATLTQLVFFPMVPYLAWAVAYYAKIFVISSKKIQHKGYETLYKYTTRNPKAAVSQFVSSVPLQWQPLAYMSLHIALTTATFAVAKIWWDSYMAHTAFLLIVFCWAVWNGANFYFNHFAYRYVAGLPHSASDATLSENGGASPRASLASPRTEGANGASPRSLAEEPQGGPPTGVRPVLADTKAQDDSGNSLVNGAAQQGLLPGSGREQQQQQQPPR